ncbi:MAG: hypothetical protein IT196_04285 [Acidimicrobiales bacterium]|nr:hypothetical protein [Acidimicrobiales bacterium]
MTTTLTTTTTTTHATADGHRSPLPNPRTPGRGRRAVGVALAAAVGLGTVALATPAGAAPGPGGAGSLTVDLHEPVEVTGHADVGVACTTKNRVYTASSTKTTVDGYQLTVRATVGGYRGAGTYPGVVNLTVVGPAGNLSGVVRNASVSIGPDGGTVDFDRVLSGKQHPKLAGKNIAGTVTWLCG